MLAMAAAAVAVCAPGLIRLRVETDPQRLWVGADSQAAREKADYEVRLPCSGGLVLTTKRVAETADVDQQSLWLLVVSTKANFEVQCLLCLADYCCDSIASTLMHLLRGLC